MGGVWPWPDKFFSLKQPEGRALKVQSAKEQSHSRPYREVSAT